MDFMERVKEAIADARRVVESEPPARGALIDRDEALGMLEGIEDRRKALESLKSGQEVLARIARISALGELAGEVAAVISRYAA
ncbi:hypothetical protein [Mycobacterium attenuatum]|uniref:hypothetical protein n=1 Tax=Mycobacterium attenuatum TaxID=2341086 RepID=UPI000F03F241|nr:hypothetical protein [Mycobacterium attenuatum]VBA62453.1 hypothetical protein LAUMK41_05844 [Mycobacterium attenuatum]